MKRSFLIFILTMIILPDAYAGCKGNIVFQDNLIVREDFAINSSQSESYSHQYNDSTCSGANTVSPLKNSDIVVGLYDNTVKLMLKFNWLSSSDISLPVGKNDFTAGYRVDISQANSSATVDISAGSGNSVYIRNVASLSSASSSSRNSAFVTLVFCILGGKGWDTCITNYRNSLAKDAGFYSTDLILTYNRKQTTCKPENLSITLPDIALSELHSAGKIVNKNAQGNIRLQCDNLFGDRKQTSRKMAVYLSSSDLLAGSNFVLRGDDSNGVGFVLENNNQTVNISRVADQGTASTLWKVDKVGGEVNSNTVMIPVIANYYVYDRNKVKPGNIKATVLIYVKYD